MASKFKPWIDTATAGTNVQSYADFNADTQRSAGFQANTASSAIRVNSALRQANLVVCALMELADASGTTDLTSSVASVKTLLQTYFASVASLPTASASTKGGIKVGGGLSIASEILSVASASASAFGGIRIGYVASGKNYPIQLDANGKAFVNVPWTDTTYATPNATQFSTSGNTFSLNQASASVLGGVRISYGTAEPTGTANVGDIYIQIEE